MQNDAQPDPEAFEDPLSNFDPPQYKSELQRVLAEELAGGIECRPYKTIDAGASIREAVKTLGETKVSSLLVVEADKVVGIFTERDVLEKVAEDYPTLADSPVSQVMTSDPTVVYESDPAAAAVAAIAVAGHRHVPVLKVDSSLLGIVSPRRFIQFLDQHLKTDAA